MNDPKAVEEALAWLETLLASPQDYAVNDGPPSVHLPVLAAAVLDLRAQLEAVKAKECWLCPGPLTMDGDADPICAECYVKMERRANAAEAEVKRLKDWPQGEYVLERDKWKARAQQAEARVKKLESDLLAMGNGVAWHEHLEGVETALKEAHEELRAAKEREKALDAAVFNLSFWILEPGRLGDGPCWCEPDMVCQGMACEKKHSNECLAIRAILAPSKAAVEGQK